MYEQIARNKRRAAVYVVIVLRRLGRASALSSARLCGTRCRQPPYGTPAPVDEPAYAAGVVDRRASSPPVPLVILYSALRRPAGARRSRGPGRPTRPQYRQLHNIVEALAIGDRPAQARGVRDRRPVAQRLRHRARARNTLPSRPPPGCWR